jgi:oligosaccharide amylase
MARALTIGNGNILVGLDYFGQVRDFYYPFVGLTNHVSGASGNFVHRIGLYIDENLYWLDDPTWSVQLGHPDNGLTAGFVAHHTSGIELKSDDEVHNEQNIFLRRIIVTNNAQETKTVKLFFSQQFRIGESRRGDTAFFDPRVGAIIHYKGRDTFLVNARINDRQFTEYNIGLFGIEGREGTYYDAYDGILEKNPIEHGSVDSVIAVQSDIRPTQSSVIEYWVACGGSIPEVHALDKYILDETPERLIHSTEFYWEAWLRQQNTNIDTLPVPIQKLFKQSLLIMRVHTDNRGGIIASSDTDMLHHGRDTYSYVWPRDGAFIAHTFDVLGYHDVAKRFFTFMANCQDPAGYLMHKYLPDGSLGSSWHSWLQNNQVELPIQEDETSSILFFLWKHYCLSPDIEYIESLYNSFIEPAARFLCEYIEPETGLPHASFDLWEEKYGTSTYTTASVYGGLSAAANFANLLGKENDARTYSAVAQRMKVAIKTILYNKDMKCFVKQVTHQEDTLVSDSTIDVSSLHGVLLYEVFEPDNVMISDSVSTIKEHLLVKNTTYGYVRYENDSYYRLHATESPNPWIITSLWMGRYLIANAVKLKELDAIEEMLLWVSKQAGSGGSLPEQIHPVTSAHMSATPLVWSHAEYVYTVKTLMEKRNELSK